MKTTGWRARLMESTRGKILDLLRSKERTVNELAAALGLTDNAVRTCPSIWNAARFQKTARDICAYRGS